MAGRIKMESGKGKGDLKMFYEFIGFKAVSHNVLLSTLIPVVP